MIKLIQNVIEEAGRIALTYFHKLEDLEIEYKSPKDLVSIADREVEKFIHSRLMAATPEFSFFGEETGHSVGLNSGKTSRWIVDPIDGTHSFLRGQYFWAVSIALEVEGKLVAGGVFAPVLGVLFLAEAGKGATKNGKPIQVSNIPSLTQAMISTGFACLRAQLENNNLNRFNRIAMSSMGQRRFGSAALDICFVADGQVDAFFEQELNLYDIAAGVVILQEAGGNTLNFAGNHVIDPKQVLCTNGKIDSDILVLM